MKLGFLKEKNDDNFLKDLCSAFALLVKFRKC